MKEEINANGSTDSLCAPLISLITEQLQSLTSKIERHKVNLTQCWTFFKNNTQYHYKEHFTSFYTNSQN